MALTTQQMISLGFKPSKRSSLYGKKYDTLVYPINDTDFLYIGYNEFTKRVNNKILWKSFKQIDSGERITYPVVHLGDTGFTELKAYLQRSVEVSDYNAMMDTEESRVAASDEEIADVVKQAESNG